VPLLRASVAVTNSSEQMIRVKLLEQENERYVRKIKGLESQLSELERVHGGRIQELLSDRRRERDKENHRQREALRQMEEGLKARERIYKERIRGLEEQVEVLKDQLAKEMRRRKVFIAGTSNISSEVTELRQDLDRSLHNVSTATANFDEAAWLLTSESQNLSRTVNKYGSEHAARLTPSKLTTQSLRGASSMDNLARASTPMRTKRTLGFDDSVGRY